MSQKRIAGVVAAALALGLLAVRSTPAKQIRVTPEDAQLRSEIKILKDTIIDLEVQVTRAVQKINDLERHSDVPELRRSLVVPEVGTGAPTAAAREENETLRAHSRWDWKAIVHELMQHWPRVELGQVESGVEACHNSSMYCQRMQVHEGKLYLIDYRAIFFDRHYAPARVLPLLETLRRHPKLPNMDIVVAANDEPRVPAIAGDRRSWTKSCRRWPGGAGAMPPAIFSSTVNRANMDLPWVDFAWFFPRKPHKLRTPPWSKLHGKLVKAGQGVLWEQKLELAMHTGNVGSGPRKRLAEVAKANPGEILVNELFIGDHAKIRETCRELGLHQKGGYQAHRCFMPFEDQCSYKYLLNSASIGYANKFKSLLLCGSVVLYVREGMHHREFYEYGLLSGVHYVAVDSAADVPAMVRWLRENDAYARAVARAGQARMSTLDVGALTDFLAEVFTQYAKRQTFPVRGPQPGAVRIDCEVRRCVHLKPSTQEVLSRVAKHPPLIPTAAG